MDSFKINNNISLSEQAKVSIEKYIKQMDLTKSNKLPREEKLAEIIGVSRVTIRAALNELAGEGTIFRRQGKGTFVNVDSLNVKVTFSPVIEFTEMIKKSGYKPGIRNLNVSDYSINEDEIKQKLLLGKEDSLVAIEKIFFADDMVCAYWVDVFSKELLCGDSFSNLMNYDKSVFEYIYEKNRAEIVWDKIDLHVVNAENIPKYSMHLKNIFSKNMPLLLLKGIDYDKNDKPLVYSMEYINTQIIQFSVIRQRKIHYK
ncbi:MAG: GntR family transcriptional regulator [Oscillospiraceae bacterium]